MLSRRLILAGVVAGLGLPLACRSRPPEADVPGLIADLQNPDPAVSGKANLALIRLGEPAAPQLAEMLKSGDVRLRTLAVTALWGFGEKGRAAVPTLAATLGDPVDSVRVGAAMALENMGPHAKDAVPDLVRSLKDRDGRFDSGRRRPWGASDPRPRRRFPSSSRQRNPRGSGRPRKRPSKIRGLREGQPVPEQ